MLYLHSVVTFNCAERGGDISVITAPVLHFHEVASEITEGYNATCDYWLPLFRDVCGNKG